VEGVYTADPRVVPRRSRLSELSYEEMQELAEAGAKVLNAQAVEFAKERGIAIYARASFAGAGETLVRKFPPRAAGRVIGIASETGVAALSCRGDEAKLATLLALLTAYGAPAKQLLFHASGESAPLTSLVLSLENLHDAAALRREAASKLGGCARVARGSWAPFPPSAPASTQAWTTCSGRCAAWRKTGRGSSGCRPPASGSACSWRKAR
jgi:aspartate kinase